MHASFIKKMSAFVLAAQALMFPVAAAAAEKPVPMNALTSPMALKFGMGKAPVIEGGSGALRQDVIQVDLDVHSVPSQEIKSFVSQGFLTEQEGAIAAPVGAKPTASLECGVRVENGVFMADPVRDSLTLSDGEKSIVYMSPNERPLAYLVRGNEVTVLAFSPALPIHAPALAAEADVVVTRAYEEMGTFDLAVREVARDTKDLPTNMQIGLGAMVVDGLCRPLVSRLTKEVVAPDVDVKKAAKQAALIEKRDDKVWRALFKLAKAAPTR